MLGFTRYDAAFFAALMSTAVALGASLAHLFELPNKIDLGRDAYFTVQGIYRGWNQLAYVLAIEFVSIIAIIILSRDARRVRLWAAVALLSLVAAQAVFWTFTYPANVATNNWTAIPADWEKAAQTMGILARGGRDFQLIAMTSLVIAALKRRSAAA